MSDRPRRHAVRLLGQIPPHIILSEGTSLDAPGRRSHIMRARGGNGLGRFSVEFEVANYGDLIRAQDGTLPSDQVRRETVRGVVDSGAARLVLPQAVVERLGLSLGNPVKVRYADGRTARRREVQGVFVKLLGRDGTFTAIAEPKRETALLGA